MSKKKFSFYMNDDCLVGLSPHLDEGSDDDMFICDKLASKLGIDRDNFVDLAEEALVAKITISIEAVEFGTLEPRWKKLP